MHIVAVLALDGVVPLDLAVSETFARARVEGRPVYDVRVCTEHGAVDAGLFRVHTRHRLATLKRAQTILVPGITDVERPVAAVVSRALRSAAARGARIASICSGAFVLASTGLLDGLRATTHWLATAELARRYPAITVDPDVLYVDNGQLLTSAGAAAGLDLCLHLVRRDHGAAVAADLARLAVMPLERAGGQAQFIDHPPPQTEGSLEPVLRWLEASVDADLSLEDIARQAVMSPRTLTRRFREQTGTTPLQFLLRARVRRAQRLLETTASSMEHVASETGFSSATALRTTFHRLVGTSPRAYRDAFRA